MYSHFDLVGYKDFLNKNNPCLLEINSDDMTEDIRSVGLYNQKKRAQNTIINL